MNLSISVHWKVAKHVKGQHVKELKQLVALTLDEHYKEHPLEKVCVLFDFTGTGLGQMVRSCQENYCVIVLSSKYEIKLFEN